MAIASVENISVNAIPTGSSLDPCRFFELSLRVVTDTPGGINIIQFNFYINKGTTNEELIVFDTNNIVSTVGDLTTYEKTVVVSRFVANQNPINYQIESILGENLYNENVSPLVSAWQISNITTSTNVNLIGTVSVQTQITGLDTLPLNIEISVDDVNYFNTNVIAGLSPGDYTLYVRDAYGCKKTIDFVINDQSAFEEFNNFKFVSLLNPVPFTKINKNRPSFENTPSYKVDHNPLSLSNKYQYIQVDPLNINVGVNPVRFQFRSNFDVNKAYLINCGEVVSEFSVNQLSSNLNQRDNRTGRFYFENGFLYAYYDGLGNVYDNDGNVIGANNLDGSLLFAQVEGEILSIENLGDIEILEIINVEGIGQVMKLNYTQPISSVYNIITTYYSLDNFEVYEFSLSLSENVGDYQIVIVNNTNAEFDENNPLSNASFISEVISIVEEFSTPMFKFVWKNSENNQFSWDTGIECYNYMPKSFEPEFQPKDENDIYTTDTTSFMLESDVFDIFVFVVERVAQITARQLMMIVSNDYLKIDDNFYVKEETPEVTRLGVSNAYNVTLNLQLASNYNSNSREGLTRNSNLISTDGFLRIR